MLQCGHGEFAVENIAKLWGVPHYSSASMRPRRIRRGEHGSAVVGEATETASMRPRRIRRGERHSCMYTCWYAGKLQCGHGEFAVENNT